MANDNSLLIAAIEKQTHPIYNENKLVERIPNDGTLHLYIIGTQCDKLLSYPPKTRNIHITLHGEKAYKFANNPNWYDLWEHYGVDGEMMEEGPDGIQVTSVS